MLVCGRRCDRLFFWLLLPSSSLPFFHLSFPRSVSPDAVYRKTRAVLTGGGETFLAHGVMVSRPGFTTIMPWKVGSVGGQGFRKELI